MRGGALASCDSDVRQSSLVRIGVAKVHCLAVPARETGYVGGDSVRCSVEKAEVESSSERGRRNIGFCFEGRNGAASRVVVVERAIRLSCLRAVKCRVGRDRW